jgi:hypothetical protein
VNINEMVTEGGVGKLHHFRETPLIRAVRDGKNAIAMFLIETSLNHEYPLDKDYTDSLSNTALDYATEMKNDEIKDILDKMSPLNEGQKSNNDRGQELLEIDPLSLDEEYTLSGIIHEEGEYQLPVGVTYSDPAKWSMPIFGEPPEQFIAAQAYSPTMDTNIGLDDLRRSGSVFQGQFKEHFKITSEDAFYELVDKQNLGERESDTHWFPVAGTNGEGTLTQGDRGVDDSSKSYSFTDHFNGSKTITFAIPQDFKPGARGLMMVTVSYDDDEPKVEAKWIPHRVALTTRAGYQDHAIRYIINSKEFDGKNVVNELPEGRLQQMNDEVDAITVEDLSALEKFRNKLAPDFDKWLGTHGVAIEKEDGVTDADWFLILKGAILDYITTLGAKSPRDVIMEDLRLNLGDDIQSEWKTANQQRRDEELQQQRIKKTGSAEAEEAAASGVAEARRKQFLSDSPPGSTQVAASVVAPPIGGSPGSSPASSASSETSGSPASSRRDSVSSVSSTGSMDSAPGVVPEVPEVPPAGPSDDGGGGGGASGSPPSTDDEDEPDPEPDPPQTHLGGMSAGRVEATPLLCDQLTAKIREITSAHAANIKKVSELEKQLREKNDALQAAGITGGQNEASITQATREKAAVAAELEATKTQLTAVETALAALKTQSEQERTQCAADIAALRGERDDFKGRLNDSEEQVAICEAKIRALRKFLIDRIIETTEEDSSQVAWDNIGDEELNDMLTGNIAKLNVTITELTTQILALEAENVALTTSGGEKDATIESLNQDQTATIQGLTQQVRELTADVQKLTQDNTSCESQLAENLTEMGKLTEEIVALKSSLEEKDTEINGLKKRIAADIAHAAVLEAEKDKLSSDKDDCETELNTIQQELAELRAASTTNQAKLLSLENSITTLTQTRDALSQENTGLRRQLGEAQEGLRVAMENLELAQGQLAECDKEKKDCLDCTDEINVLLDEALKAGWTGSDENLQRGDRVLVWISIDSADTFKVGNISGEHRNGGYMIAFDDGSPGDTVTRDRVRKIGDAGATPWQSQSFVEGGHAPRGDGTEI